MNITVDESVVDAGSASSYSISSKQQLKPANSSASLVDAKDAAAVTLTLWSPKMNDNKKLPISSSLPPFTRSFLAQVDVSAFGVSCPSFPFPSSSPLNLNNNHATGTSSSHNYLIRRNQFNEGIRNGTRNTIDTRTTSFAAGCAVSSSPSFSWCSSQMTDTSPFGIPRRLLGQPRQELIDFLLCYLEDPSALDHSTRLSSHIERELWELCSMFNGDVEALIDAMLSLDAENRPRDFCDLIPALAIYCDLNGNTKNKSGNKLVSSADPSGLDGASSPVDSSTSELLPSASLSPHERVRALLETVALTSQLSSSNIDDLLHTCNGIEGLFTAVLCMPLPQSKKKLQSADAEQVAVGINEDNGSTAHVPDDSPLVTSLSSFPVAPAPPVFEFSSSSSSASLSDMTLCGLSLQSCVDRPRLVASESLTANELYKQIRAFVEAPDLFLQKELPSKEKTLQQKADTNEGAQLDSVTASRPVSASITPPFPPSSHISDVQRLLTQVRLVESNLFSHTLESVSLSESKIDELIQAAHGFMSLWSILTYLAQQRNFAPQSFGELEFLIAHHRLHKQSTPSHHQGTSASNRAAESKERMHEHALRAAMHGGDGGSHFHANDEYEEFKMPLEEHAIESSLLNDLAAAVELQENVMQMHNSVAVLNPSALPLSLSEPRVSGRFTQSELQSIASKLRATRLLSSSSSVEDGFESLDLHSLSIDYSGGYNSDGSESYRKLLAALDILANNGVRAKSLHELRSLVRQHYAHSQPQRYQLPMPSQSTCIIL